MDDIWTFQKIGTPFPRNVAKAPGETNKYVALWYRHGKPVMGRAWNDSGVVQVVGGSPVTEQINCQFQCTFVADNKLFSGADVGGVIQLLSLEHGDMKTPFYYDWIKYKKARSLTNEGKHEMVRCEFSTPAYWQEHGLLGCLNTDRLVAQFVDNDLQLKTTKKVEDLSVLCKIAGSRGSAEKEKTEDSLNPDHRLPTIVNDWEDFNWGSTWPGNKNVMSTPQSASVPAQFVALWYRHGKPIMGRAWAQNGKIEASFVDANREFTGATVGSLQLLIRQPPTTVGYDYVWMSYEQAADHCDKDFVPVHLSYTCPAIVPVTGKPFLGQVNMKTECATVAVDGKVTQLEGGPVKSLLVLCRREMDETMLI